MSASKTLRDHRAAKRFENDCQFGLVSAERVPKREENGVIKPFSSETYGFQSLLFQSVIGHCYSGRHTDNIHRLNPVS